MKIFKIAASPEQDIKSLKRDVTNLEKDLKTIEKDVKKIGTDLNLGDRRFWQQKTTFTSIQRKIERLEKMEQEWKKFKKEMEDKFRKEIESHSRAQVTN